MYSPCTLVATWLPVADSSCKMSPSRIVLLGTSHWVGHSGLILYMLPWSAVMRAYVFLQDNEDNNTDAAPEQRTQNRRRQQQQRRSSAQRYSCCVHPSECTAPVIETRITIIRSIIRLLLQTCLRRHRMFVLEACTKWGSAAAKHRQCTWQWCS